MPFLSAHSFVQIWIWKDFFKFYLLKEKESVFLFSAYDGIWYLPVPPLGESPLKKTIPFAFEVLDQLNRVKTSSRIENLHLAELGEVGGARFRFILKSWDYVYDSVQLMSLKGNRFKEKRWGANYFVKHYGFEYRPYEAQDLPGCRKLYEEWKEKKKADAGQPEESYCQDLLEESALAHRRMMEDYEALGLTGRVITIGSEIKGFIFGFELQEGVWVVLAEITDHSVKGIAQYIFKRFCEEFKHYPWINTMDDSGLPQLSRVKNSYCPGMFVPSYSLVHQTSGMTR